MKFLFLNFQLKALNFNYLKKRTLFIKLLALNLLINLLFEGFLIFLKFNSRYYFNFEFNPFCGILKFINYLKL
jgi:hypothetical protein